MRFFFFNDTATTEIYTLSLHDALPISIIGAAFLTPESGRLKELVQQKGLDDPEVKSRIGRITMVVRIDFILDRKSTRLNSSHANISYAVFCLKKKVHTIRRYERHTSEH